MKLFKFLKYRFSNWPWSNESYGVWMEYENSPVEYVDEDLHSATLSERIDYALQMIRWRLGVR